MSTTPAGWYPDPIQAGIKRWWDGTTWSVYTQTPLPTASEQSSLSQLEWAALGGPRPKRLFSKTFLWIAGIVGGCVILLILFIAVILIGATTGH